MRVLLGRCGELNELRKLDSIKSRLQTTRQRVSIPRLALTVYQEEGIVGFYRGLWIPLITISFVRTCYYASSVMRSVPIAAPRRCIRHNLLAAQGVLP